MATVHALSEREADIMLAYARGAQLADIATTWGESRDYIAAVLGWVNLNRTAAGAAHRAGQVTIHGRAEVRARESRRTVEPTVLTVTVAKPASPGVATGLARLAATPAEEIEALKTAALTLGREVEATGSETVLAEYNAMRCPSCQWIGVDGHAHPTFPVTVRIVTREVD